MLAAVVTCVVLAAPSAAMATTASAISADWENTCALTSSDGAKCWGYNASGQLGDGTATGPERCEVNSSRFPCSTTPADVSGLTSGLAAISSGGGIACALTSGGGVKCWGDNEYGSLGDGSTTGPERCRNGAEPETFACSTRPVDVSGLSSGVTAIGAGQVACALTSGGGVKCWGANYAGQLGDGISGGPEQCGPVVEPSACSRTPVVVSGLASGVAAISVGGGVNACALTSAGGAKCWGANGSGQVGDGTTTDKSTPVDVSGLTSGVAALSAGDGSTCALTSTGGVKCWGYNGQGQLGDGTQTNKATPVNVTGLSSGVTAISPGSDHTCALTSAGAVKCWGSDISGQLGDGTTRGKEECSFHQCSTTPVDVRGLSSGVTAIAAGKSHTCALMSAGEVECWGYGGVGELGDGASGYSATPVAVLGLFKVTCASNSGSITLTPGVTTTSGVQAIKIKGLMTGCEGDRFATVKYTARLTTTGPVSCSTLNQGGEAAAGTAKFKWTPKAKPSTATLSLPLSETPGLVFSGELTSGSYAPRGFSARLTESYNVPCGGKPVKKGTFSGSQVTF
jgi:alpha-tubulin suppressor-like RCC1 family protein